MIIELWSNISRNSMITDCAGGGTSGFGSGVGFGGWGGGGVGVGTGLGGGSGSGAVGSGGRGATGSGNGGATGSIGSTVDRACIVDFRPSMIGTSLINHR
jgi:hypothetical protein